MRDRKIERQADGQRVGYTVVRYHCGTARYRVDALASVGSYVSAAVERQRVGYTVVRYTTEYVPGVLHNGVVHNGVRTVCGT